MRIIEDAKEFDQLLKDEKAVFVDFYADWCGPCKMLAPVVEELSGEIPDVTFVKVNVDDNPELAERYGVMSIPNLIGFKNGEVAAQTVGFQPKAALERTVLQLL